MTEFKKGDLVVLVEDDSWLTEPIPKGTRGICLEDSSINGAPSVRLDSGERVRVWGDRIAHAEPETEPETEEISIHRARDFRVGDVITVSEHSENEAALPLIRVRREKTPEPPKPKPGTFGTATVEGGRVRGFVTRRHFVYLVNAPVQDEPYGYNVTTEFEDFEPERTAAPPEIPSVEDLAEVIAEGTLTVHMGDRGLGTLHRVIPKAAARRVRSLLAKKAAS